MIVHQLSPPCSTFIEPDIGNAQFRIMIHDILINEVCGSQNTFTQVLQFFIDSESILVVVVVQKGRTKIFCTVRISSTLRWFDNGIEETCNPPGDQFPIGSQGMQIMEEHDASFAYFNVFKFLRWREYIALNLIKLYSSGELFGDHDGRGVGVA